MRTDTRHRLLAMFLSFTVTALMCMGFVEASFATVATAPELIAETAVLINASTGEVLYDKVKDYQEFPASTTKIMTALLTLENKDLGETVTISHNASNTEGSRVYLSEGEQVTIEQLLYAMMLESANDAAIALAEAVAGDTDSFAVMMNERATEIGAKNTHFVTPNGLPNDQHLTTAYDLALIARTAMQNETFRKIVGTAQYVMPATNLNAEARTFNNSNKLINPIEVNVDGVSRSSTYQGVTGIKTGYTNAAGSCLVASASRDGVELIGVILHSDIDNQYPDMIKLLDYGFANYMSITIVKAGDEVATAKVKKAKGGKAGVTVAADVTGTVERTSDGSDPSKYGFTYTVTTYELTAPVAKGTSAGKLTLYNGNVEAGTYELIVMDDVELSGFSKLTSTIAGKMALLVIGCAIVIAALMVLYMVFVLNVRRNHKKQIKQRRAMREARREQRRSYYDDSSNVYMSYGNDLLDPDFDNSSTNSKEPEVYDTQGAYDFEEDYENLYDDSFSEVVTRVAEDQPQDRINSILDRINGDKND